MYRHDFGSFIPMSFRTLNPAADYYHNWHIDAIAHHLNQVMQGKIKRLLITLPPATLKSHCVSVAWPAWMLGRNPNCKLLYLHVSHNLGRELHDQTVRLMRSNRYKALFDNLKIDINTRSITTEFGGQRQFTTMLSHVTGLHCDIAIIDDPISALDVLSPKLRHAVKEQFDYSILQRLNKNSGAIIVVMQRLHEDDLAAYLMKKEGWVHLDLSALALKDEECHLTHGRIHHRKKGEALHPALHNHKQLAEILRQIGGYAFNYQYLQGQYPLRFGEQGWGTVFASTMRQGQFYDATKHWFTNESKPQMGFVDLKEEDIMLPRLFGIGHDPCPPDMRTQMNMDEYLHALSKLSEYQKKMADDFENKTGAYAFLKDRKKKELI